MPINSTRVTVYDENGVEVDFSGMSGGTPLATTNDRIPYSQVFAYDLSGNLTTITKTYDDGVVSTKTFSYTGGNLTGIDNVVT